MKERYTNYLQVCREQAGLSRDDVALFCNKSMETIGARERGEVLAPYDEVLWMEEGLFKRPGMALEYLRLTNPIAAKYIPANHLGLLENVVQIDLSSKDMAHISPDLMRAAMDGTLMNDSPEIIQKAYLSLNQLASSVLWMLPKLVVAGIT